MLSTFCPPTIWAISLEFYGKPSILEVDDFLGARCTKLWPPKSYGLYFFHTRVIWHFWCFWRFPVEIAHGMSKNTCNYCNAGKEKGRKAQESPNPPPKKKSYSKMFRLTLIRWVIFGESWMGNTIRGNGTESLWEGNLPLRGSLRGRVLRDPLRGRFHSQRLSVLLPLIVLPLEVSRTKYLAVV